MHQREFAKQVHQGCYAYEQKFRKCGIGEILHGIRFTMSIDKNHAVYEN
jgi:hypothetical protein